MRSFFTSTRMRTACAAILLAGWFGAAAASPITRNFAFTATNGTDTVTGAFSATFEPTFTGDGVGQVTFQSWSIPQLLAVDAGYAYNPTDDQLTIGGKVGGITNLLGGIPDFGLQFANAQSDDPIFQLLAYTLPGVAGAVVLRTGSIAVVDEPFGLALLAIGAVGAAAIRRRGPPIRRPA